MGWIRYVEFECRGFHVSFQKVNQHQNLKTIAEKVADFPLSEKVKSNINWMFLFLLCELTTFFHQHQSPN